MLGYVCLFELWFSQSTCSGVGLLDYMAVLFLVFKGISILFCTVSMSIYIPTNCASGFPFLHILSSIVCRIFDNGSSDLCEAIRHWGFDLHFTGEEIKAQTSLLPTALVLLSEEARIWTWVSLNPKPAFFSTTYSDGCCPIDFLLHLGMMTYSPAFCRLPRNHSSCLRADVRGEMKHSREGIYHSG